MEIGILILIILGSFIFKKGKANEESSQKPVPSKDMTWEEMEEYYGITLSRKPEEPMKRQSDITTENTSEGATTMGNPVDVDKHEKVVDSVPCDTEAIRAAVYDSTETITRESDSKSIEQIREVEPSTLGISRKKSLQMTARQGMVWSMILEPPKGARMLSRFRFRV